MNDKPDSAQAPVTGKSSLVSRGSTILIAFLAISALLLILEHRVHVFAGRSVLLGLLALSVIMAAFMYGEHARRRRRDGERPGHREDRS